MCERVKHQPTNCPEVDAGRTPAEAAKNRRRAITRKTTAKQIETDLEHHKRMNRAPFPWLLPQALCSQR